jgi:D-alanyl-D-alanine carboxypeptidase/D-alanyl-D-alanine-endopeptidase (penicillin-binding protein 4)
VLAAGATRVAAGTATQSGGVEPSATELQTGGGSALTPLGVPSPEALAKRLRHELAAAGRASGGEVLDLSDQQLLFSASAEALHPPASVEKLYTATTVLEHFGSSARLETTVLGVGQLQAGGLWDGNLYLRGGGDPTFGSQAFIRAHYGGLGTSVQAVASALVRAGIHRISGRIFGDESYFDSLRGDPSSGYAPDPYLEGTLSALAFNRGETGAYSSAHAPAQFAAHELAEALRADHVAVVGSAGAATTPAGATMLAQIPSPTIAQLLGLTLPPSDNFFAEMLLKGLGARFAGAGTTAAGAALVRSTIATLVGIHPALVDGSGLSTEDRTSPAQVVALLRYLASSPLAATIRSVLAVAGRSGTLAERMRHSPAAGRCQGKTGTLTGVSNLAGYCEASDNQLVAFAIFNDNIATEAAHVIQDKMAITIVGY